MAFNITVQDVDVSKPEGKKYWVAKVVYTYKGQNKTQNLMDFANPQVFKDIQNFKGQEVTVETGKNDKGYDTWTKVYSASEAAPAAAKAATSGTVQKSSYETPEERKQRQLLIVKQSSITSAIATLSINPGKDKLQVDEVLSLAQKYVDFVYGVDEIVDKAE